MKNTPICKGADVKVRSLVVLWTIHSYYKFTVSLTGLVIYVSDFKKCA